MNKQMVDVSQAIAGPICDLLLDFVHQEYAVRKEIEATIGALLIVLQSSGKVPSDLKVECESSMLEIQVHITHPKWNSSIGISATPLKEKE